jgi:hypothetical protein
MDMTDRRGLARAFHSGARGRAPAALVVAAMAIGLGISTLGAAPGTSAAPATRLTPSAPSAALSAEPASGGLSPTSPPGTPFGPTRHGSYHLGPVTWQGGIWNSCGPYPAAIQKLEGAYIAGVDNSLNGDGSLCDAWALVTTRLGKKIVVRIVTTGVSNAPGDMDLSPAAYDAIYRPDPKGTSSNPRPMSWRLIKGKDNGHIVLQYQTGANPWWTSLWVRNPRYPVKKVEVKLAGRSAYRALTLGTDGTWTDGSGFGSAAFTLRITGRDGQVLYQSFSSFTAGSLVTTALQFR